MLRLLVGTLALSIANWAWWVYVLFRARFTDGNDWRILVDFNRYNEGWFELVLMSVLLLVHVWAWVRIVRERLNKGDA